MTQTLDAQQLAVAVQSLRAAVEATHLPIDTPQSGDARRHRAELLNQLDDYVLPRLSALDAPLLCVVGGSTGAGKSTLVNSVVGQAVSRAGVLRPTTRASVLVHHPDDTRWFADDRVLPGLARLTGTTGEHDDPGQLRLVTSSQLPPGLALLDAPDIDSVVEANRDLARQLLSAADLWLFVTTAARYADAVPWQLLHQATERGTAVAVVLNRTPPEAMAEVRDHLASMLTEQGLGSSPVFTVAETRLDDGAIPPRDVARVRSWLTTLAADARARSIVIRRTLTGALTSLDARAGVLAEAVRAQDQAVAALVEAPTQAYDHALAQVEEGMTDGSLLRGEVLARWQDFVGTGEWFRQLDAGVGRLRDRVTGYLTGRGRSQPTEELGQALHTGVAQLIASHGEAAVLEVSRRWRQQPGGAQLLSRHPELGRTAPDFDDRVQRLVREWQGQVMDMVREEAGGRRTTARFLAFGVNGIAVLLMLLVFSATAGLSGAEVGIAGGSAVVAQRLLEAVFGDQAVRSLAAKARRALLADARALYDAERQRFESTTAEYDLDPEAATRLVRSSAEVRKVR